MITIDDLQAVADKQRKTEEHRSEGLMRNVNVNDDILDTHALILTGVRRCGKSTVMTQRIPFHDFTPDSLAS